MTTPHSLPTTVLAGYLGAGKTTLLNRLLTQTATSGTSAPRLAVMVNDFGDINIDAALIQDQSASTITLSNGCICCSIGGALYDAIDALLRQPVRPDHLLIEASGVAEPKRIANIAHAEPDLTLDAIVTLIDLEQFPLRLADHRVSDSVQAQVTQADLIVFTKADIAGASQQQLTCTKVSQLAPNTPTLTAVAGDLDPQLLLGVAADYAEVNNPATAASAFLRNATHDSQYLRWSIRSNAQLNDKQLRTLLRELPRGLLRLKGFVGRSDQVEPTLVQIVGMRVNLSDVTGASTINDAACTQLVAITLDGEAEKEFLSRLTSHLN